MKVWQFIADGLPRFVAYGDPEAFWNRRWEWSGSRINLWLQSLPEMPEVSTLWLPQGEFKNFKCRQIVRARLRQIADWAGGHPKWLLSPQMAGRRRPRPVVRIGPDGSVTAYASLLDAANRTGLGREAVVHRLLSGADGWHEYDANPIAGLSDSSNVAEMSGAASAG